MMEKSKKEYDELYKRMKEVGEKLAIQDKQKMSYEIICNEPIHPNVSKKAIPFKFEIPKIEPFKGK